MSRLGRTLRRIRRRLAGEPAAPRIEVGKPLEVARLTPIGADGAPLSKTDAFQAGVALVLGEVAKGHQIGISAAWTDEGHRVLISAGTKAIMMGSKEAHRLADAYSSPLALAAGLGELAADLREAATLVASASNPS